MKKSTLLFGIIFGITVLTRIALADGKDISEYKTAQECYDAAMKIDRTGISPADQTAVWGRKFALLGQAIALDPKFTQAYVPYVQTYFEQPMGHEYTDSEELDRLTALLKKGLEYHPPNGDEFYMQLVELEDKRFGSEEKESILRSIQYLEKAQALYPNSHNILKMLSRKSYCYYLLGNETERVKISEEIISKFDPQEELVKLTYYDLIDHYFEINDFIKVVVYADNLLSVLKNQDKISFDSVLWYKIKAYDRLNRYPDVISTANSLLNFYQAHPLPNYSKNSYLPVIYDYLNRAYKNTGNSVLAEKYKNMEKQK